MITNLVGEFEHLGDCPASSVSGATTGRAAGILTLREEHRADGVFLRKAGVLEHLGCRMVLWPLAGGT